MRIGLPVYLHDHFASKYLVDILYQLGLCKSYKEVLRYERSAALTFKQYDVNITSTQKFQFMADNVGHDPCNFNGENTVYYIGMPIALTPFSDNTFRIVPRKDVLNDQLKGLNSQMVKHFDMEGIKKLGGVKYKPYISVEQREDPYILLDVHWKSEQLSFWVRYVNVGCIFWFPPLVLRLI